MPKQNVGTANETAAVRLMYLVTLTGEAQRRLVSRRCEQSEMVES
jgi:hypothetical protein